MKRVKFDMSANISQTATDYNVLDEDHPVAGQSDGNSNGKGSTTTTTPEARLPFNKRHKHTLDSDEEDDEFSDEQEMQKIKKERRKKRPQDSDSDSDYMGEDYTLGESEDIGAELTKGDGVQWTAFNMKEELEEGRFDSNRMFIFSRQKQDIHDNWLDNVDWASVTEQEQSEIAKQQQQFERLRRQRGLISDDADDSGKVDKEDCLCKMLPLMQAGETVQKAIQRWGKNKLPASLRLKAKNKKGTLTEQQRQEVDADEARRTKLNELMELADKIVTTGDVGIYELTYEAIQKQAQGRLQKMQQHEQQISQQFEVEPEDDLFSDNFGDDSSKKPADEKSAENNAAACTSLDPTTSTSY